MCWERCSAGARPKEGRIGFWWGKSFWSQALARDILEHKSRGGGSRCLRDLAKWTKMLRHRRVRRGGRREQHAVRINSNGGGCLRADAELSALC